MVVIEITKILSCLSMYLDVMVPGGINAKGHTQDANSEILYINHIHIYPAHWAIEFVFHRLYFIDSTWLRESIYTERGRAQSRYYYLFITLLASHAPFHIYIYIWICYLCLHQTGLNQMAFASLKCVPGARSQTHLWCCRSEDSGMLNLSPLIHGNNTTGPQACATTVRLQSSEAARPAEVSPGFTGGMKSVW